MPNSRLGCKPAGGVSRSGSAAGGPDNRSGSAAGGPDKRGYNRRMKRPPLDAVRTVRARKVDAAALETRRAADVADRARAIEARAREAEEHGKAEAARLEADERQRISSTTSARELAQLGAFEVGNALTRERLEARTAAAARDTEAALDAERARRSTLATAEAELDAVKKHQEAWRKTEAAHAQEKADEAAEESHAARRRRE